MTHFPVLALELALIFFWAAWFAIVAATNLCGGLKAAGRLPPSWRFASTNFEAVKKAVSIYAAPPWVAAFLFTGVIAWQLAACALFACAALASLQAHALSWPAVHAAFAAAIGLWAAFMLADEITLKYAYEQTHELLFLAQLATLVALHLLPA
jgi:hypothetical protein